MIFSTVAGIIHLGELNFVTRQLEDGQDVAAIDDADPVVSESLGRGAELLGFDAHKLKDTLTSRWVVIKRKQTTESYQVPRTEDQATATLQSLLKMLFKRLFDLICDQINVSMYGGEGQKKARHIGILDIYGFESLQVG